MVSVASLIPTISLADTFFGILPASGGSFAASRSLTVSAAAVQGATTIQVLSPVAGHIIKPGTVMTVLTTVTGKPYTSRRVPIQYTGTVDLTVGTTAVAMAIKPLLVAVVANSTIESWANLIPVLGLSEFGAEPNTQTGDATGTDSGSGTVTVVYRTSQALNITLHERPEDFGIELVKRALEGTNDLVKNNWVVMIRPDGETKKGVAVFAAGSTPGGVNVHAQQSFTMNFQGSTYVRDPAYIFP